MHVLTRVRRFVAEHDLLQPTDRVIAAVSGGSDSVALACLLHELHARAELELVGLVHFNHQLRPNADHDERCATALGTSLGLSIFTGRGDVAARARRERRSLEDAARGARYECFARAREHFRADVVALGHTRDDQAETVLLRLLRGAGLRGLAAMHPRNGFVVRPLLACRRAELRAYLDARGIAYVDDESNEDVSIPRNRIRAELIPLLASRFNAAIVDVLAGEAEVAREVWEWVDAAARAAAAEVVRVLPAVEENAKAAEASQSLRSSARLSRAPRSTVGDVRVIDLARFEALAPALRRAVLWRTMRDVSGGRPIGFEHVAAALRVATADGPPAIDAPGQRLQRIGRTVVLTGRPPNAKGRHLLTGEPPANLFRYPLSIPGEVQLPESGCILSAEPVCAAGLIETRAAVGNGAVAAVRGDLVHGSLAVRNRRPGDRFQPVGLGGRKKLQDFFVDRKIARHVRDTVPIVVDDSDRIVWVAGYRIDEAFRVTNASQHVLLLRLTQAPAVWGGSV